MECNILEFFFFMGKLQTDSLFGITQEVFHETPHRLSSRSQLQICAKNTYHAELKLTVL